MTNKLQLSVIIVSYNSLNTIERCLESLKNQKNDKTFEIIVIDSSTDGADRLVEERFSNVNLYRFSERKFPGDARNSGISVAKGEIIAFIDADCTADRNWADEILKAHRSPHLAIGGAIANGNPDSYVSWAAYLCEFSQWMPYRHARWLTDMPTANMSYKRKVFEQYGNFIERTYCSDTDFHWRLGQNGHRLRFIPTILIYHHNINNFGGFLRHEYNHGRAFAQVRIKSKKFSKLKRFVYTICFPLITIKLFLKIGIINFKNRIYLLYFLKTIPLLTLGLISWSLGECIGYMKG